MGVLFGVLEVVVLRPLTLQGSEESLLAHLRVLRVSFCGRQRTQRGESAKSAIKADCFWATGLFHLN